MFLYLLNDGNLTAPTKIGITGDLKGRLSTYMTGSPKRDYRFTKSWELDNASDIEKIILAHAREMGWLTHGRGEWVNQRASFLADWIEDELELTG